MATHEDIIRQIERIQARMDADAALREERQQLQDRERALYIEQLDSRKNTVDLTLKDILTRLDALNRRVSGWMGFKNGALFVLTGIAALVGGFLSLAWEDIRRWFG